jgi:hypothetical protein
MSDEQRFYRVEIAAGQEGCKHCGEGTFYTVVSGTGADECEVGQSWGHKESVEDICDLMNMAYDAGQESTVSNAEEDKLVAFFRSSDGDRLGRDGDADNLSPAETAIRAMRRGL